MFPCDKCGACCKQVGNTPLGKWLALPNGVCRYFSKENNLCTIYVERPIICNIDAFYDKYLANDMKLEEFYNINKKYCEILKSNI